LFRVQKLTYTILFLQEVDYDAYDSSDEEVSNEARIDEKMNISFITTE